MTDGYPTIMFHISSVYGKTEIIEENAIETC